MFSFHHKCNPLFDSVTRVQDVFGVCLNPLKYFELNIVVPNCEFGPFVKDHSLIRTFLMVVMKYTHHTYWKLFFVVVNVCSTYIDHSYTCTKNISYSKKENHTDWGNYLNSRVPDDFLVSDEHECAVESGYEIWHAFPLSSGDSFLDISDNLRTYRGVAHPRHHQGKKLHG